MPTVTRKRRRIRSIGNHLLPWMVGLALALVGTPAAQAADSSGAVCAYHLNAPARVSMLIMNPDGRVVRELLHAAPRETGDQREPWDGRDEAGAALPAGRYTWKLLTTQGLTAEYLLTLGTNPDVPYDPWPGNHGGLWSVAADAEGMYFGGGSGEGTPLLVKQSFDGKRLWTIPNWLVAWAGVTDMAVDGQVVYLLTQSIYRYDATKGTPIGTPWVSDEIKSAVQIAARGGQIVILCPDAPQLRWLDPNDGHVVDQATLADSLDVAIDAEGTVIAVAGGQVVSLTRADKTPKTVIPAAAMVSPVRISIDPTSGELYVAENPYPKFDNSTPPTWDNKDGQQVKRFSRDGKLLQAYGKVGGRVRYGPYDPRGFAGIVNLAADGKGGFLVTEPAIAPRRTAHFAKDGTLLREWYGGQQYSNFAAVLPDDPTIVWMDSHWGELIQAKVDYEKRTWKVVANYRLAGLADGLVGMTYHGGGRWYPIRHGGQTYLCREDSPCVVRVDEKAGVATAVVASSANIQHYFAALTPKLQELVGGSIPAAKEKGRNVCLWTDANGDGHVTPDECQFAAWWNWSLGWHVDTEGNYYFDRYVVRVQRWTDAGVPIYPPPEQWMSQTFAKEEVDLSHYRPGGPSRFWHDPSGATFGFYNVGTDHPEGVGFWASSVGSQRLYKWNKDGNTQWVVGRHAKGAVAAPGEAKFLWRFVGTTHDCVVVDDVEESMVHVWDTDGLWVGRLFDHHAGPAPDVAYTLCGENFHGSLYTDPKTGEVIYFGGGQNSTHVYRITGWDKFERQNGVVELPAPAATQPATQPAS